MALPVKLTGRELIVFAERLRQSFPGSVGRDSIPDGAASSLNWLADNLLAEEAREAIKEEAAEQGFREAQLLAGTQVRPTPGGSPGEGWIFVGDRWRRRVEPDELIEPEQDAYAYGGIPGWVFICPPGQSVHFDYASKTVTVR